MAGVWVTAAFSELLNGLIGTVRESVTVDCEQLPNQLDHLRGDLCPMGGVSTAMRNGNPFESAPSSATVTPPHTIPIEISCIQQNICRGEGRMEGVN